MATKGGVMRFKLDENLDPRFGAPLEAAGHDVASVRGQNLGGRSDEVIAAVCTAENRTLITLDLDFSNPIRFPVKQTAGIIILRPPKATLTLIQQLLRELPALLQSHSPGNALWILEFGRLRIFTPEDNEGR
jgi:predicted nuclease of predicted toxin-antitoxin system